jgi:hypothetical protein
MVINAIVDTSLIDLLRAFLPATAFALGVKALKRRD